MRWSAASWCSAAAGLTPRTRRFPGSRPPRSRASGGPKHDSCGCRPRRASASSIDTSPPSRTWRVRRATGTSPSGSAQQWIAWGIEDVHIVTHDVLLPYPQEVRVEMTAPKPWTGLAPGRRRRRRSRHGTGRGPDVPRVLGIRRRHGAGRLRRQRQPGELRLAGRAGHRPRRQDRARPLLRALQLSRLQGAHGPAARPRRHPHLLGSGGRRVREGEDVSGRARGGPRATSSAAASRSTSSCPAIR